MSDTSKEFPIEDDINWEGVARQTMWENEDLRKRLAHQYLSRPPVVDEIKWWFGWLDREVGKLDPNKVVVYATIIGMMIEIMRKLRGGEDG